MNDNDLGRTVPRKLTGSLSEQLDRIAPVAAKENLKPYTIENDKDEDKDEELSKSKSDSFTSQKFYLELFEEECRQELALTNKKNRDYAGEKDAFQNFRAIEFLSAGNISTEMGILVRITDKLQRCINILNSGETHVKDEKITDTLRDLSVYSKILRIYIMRKQ